MPSLQLLTDETLAVKSGRVTKKKAPAGPKIKPEPLAEDEDDMLMNDAGADGGDAVGGGEAGDDLDKFM
jgi:hypothetical protein